MSRSPQFLSEAVRASLLACLGPERVIHREEAGGVGAIDPPPEFVVLPERSDEVAVVLRAAQADRIAVVVCGSRSRLLAPGGRRLPENGYVLLDLRGLSGVEGVQAESLNLSVRSGTPLAVVAEVAARCGCRPAGFAPAESGTVGGWLSRCARIPDPVTGGLQPPVLSLEAVLPTGNLVRSVVTPRAAVGPDLFSLFLGTFGLFGVITRATLKLEPLPQRSSLVQFRFPNIASACRLLKTSVSLPLAPRRASVVFDRAAGSEIVRMEIVLEGEEGLLGLARKILSTAAKEAGVQGTSSSEPGTRSTCASVGEQTCEVSMRWSAVHGSLERLVDGARQIERAVLDRPELTGCRLRLFGQRINEAQSFLKELLGRDAGQMAALGASGERLGRVRQRLDPHGLLNPQAWPPSWPGGLDWT